MDAHCSRVRCDQTAVVSLVIDTRRAIAWLEAYDARSTAIPLCETHADRIRPPTGWDLEDHRTPRTFAAENVVQLPVDDARNASDAENAAEEKTEEVEEPEEVEEVEEKAPAGEDAGHEPAVAAEASQAADEHANEGDDEPEERLRLRLFPEEESDPESLDTDGDTPMLSRAFRIAARPDGS